MDSGKEIARGIKFVFFSVSAGVIEFASFTLLNGATQWDYWLKYLIALILSVLWNFTLNRRFTFRSAGNVPAAMAKVACFYAVFTPLTTILYKGGHVYHAPFLARRTVNEEGNGCMSLFMTSGRAV